jgi:hypothetical protein
LLLQAFRTFSPATNKSADLEGELLQRPEEERWRLAETLLSRLPASAGAAWAPETVLSEAERRDAELERGEAKPLTEEEFWAGGRRRG